MAGSKANYVECECFWTTQCGSWLSSIKNPAISRRFCHVNLKSDLVTAEVTTRADRYLPKAIGSPRRFTGYALQFVDGGQTLRPILCMLR